MNLYLELSLLTNYTYLSKNSLLLLIHIELIITKMLVIFYHSRFIFHFSGTKDCYISYVKDEIKDVTTTK